MQVTTSTILTFPSDANLSVRNVHGGEIMKRIDQVGVICAMRHARVPLVTACLSRMDFVRPLTVGSVVNLFACVTFVSRRSIEVTVEVRSETLDNMDDVGGGMLTNKAVVVFSVARPGDTVPAMTFPLGGAAPFPDDPEAERALEDEEAFLSAGSASGSAKDDDELSHSAVLKGAVSRMTTMRTFRGPTETLEGATAEVAKRLDASARRLWCEGFRRYLESRERRSAAAGAAASNASSASSASNAAEEAAGNSETKPNSSENVAREKGTGGDAAEPTGSAAHLDATGFPPEFADGAPGVSTLTHVCLPQDSVMSATDRQNQRAMVYGGVCLKIIDNVSGIAAFRHVRTNVVTASIEDTDLFSPVRVGDLITARSRVVFASSRSMEIACMLVAESPLDGSQRPVARATSVFISLGDDGSVLQVPAVSRGEGRVGVLFDEAKERYERRRRARAAAKQATKK